MELGQVPLSQASSSVMSGRSQIDTKLYHSHPILPDPSQLHLQGHWSPASQPGTPIHPSPTSSLTSTSPLEFAGEVCPIQILPLLLRPFPLPNHRITHHRPSRLLWPTQEPHPRQPQRHPIWVHLSSGVLGSRSLHPTPGCRMTNQAYSIILEDPSHLLNNHLLIDTFSRLRRHSTQPSHVVVQPKTLEGACKQPQHVSIPVVYFLRTLCQARTAFS